ncbi:MAG: hypothetical protein NXI22_19490 [bacterium]|nr:hypothetical protein [bacterium]
MNIRQKMTSISVLAVALLISFVAKVAFAEDGCAVYQVTTPTWISPSAPLDCPVPFAPIAIQPPVVCEPFPVIVRHESRVVVAVDPCPRPTFTKAGVTAFGKLFQQAAEKGVENAMVRGFNALKTENDAAECPPEEKAAKLKK